MVAPIARGCPAPDGVPERQTRDCMRSIRNLVASVAILLLVGAGASEASAYVLPLGQIDGTYFPARAENVQVVGLHLQATPTVAGRAGGAAGYEWMVECEVRLRNISEREIVLPVAMFAPSAPEGQSEMFVNGHVAETQQVRVRRDPAYAFLQDGDYPVTDLVLPSLEIVTVRVKTIVDSQRDTLGQTVLQLPTEMYQLYNGPIAQTFIELELPERPIGLVASLQNYTFYDEPENRLSWLALEWRPQQNLEVAWLGAWPALLLVAEVEECPQPWRVVRGLMNGQLASIREYLTAFDDSTLSFCQSLPLVLHGYQFRSEAVRNRLQNLSVNRYLGGRTDRGSLYRTNPRFQEGDLGESERLYRRALNAELQRR